VAQHLTQAALAERAIEFWLKAARTAVGSGAVAEAMAQLSRGLALVGELRDEAARRRLEIELQIALGNALMAAKGYSAAETDAAFRRACELCLDAGDTTQLVRVLWGQFTGHFAGGRQRPALAVAEELSALSERLGDAGGRQLGEAGIGACLMHLGLFAKAQPHFERALAIDPAHEREWALRYGQSGRVVALSYWSLNQLLLGFADEAVGLAEQAVQTAQRLAHPPSLCFAHSIVSRTYYLRGDTKRLAQHAAMVVQLAEQHGLGLWQALGSIYTGWSRGEHGAVDQAVALMRAGLEKYRASGAALGLPLYTLGLARVEARAGREGEALRLLDEARAAMAAAEERWIAAELDRFAGDMALASPEPNAANAEACFEAALRSAREQQAKWLELRAATSLARLWREQGRAQQARDLLAPICGDFAEGFDSPALREAKDLLGAAVP
jgi:predicted ATPase